MVETSSGKLGWPALLVLLGAVGCALFVSQAATPPTENKEIRIFKVVQSMADSGDWIVPRMDGKPRLNKPPLYYWLATAARKATGLGERAGDRLPSALFAFGFLAAAFGFCRAAGALGLAFPVALAIAGAADFISNGRIANFDMALGFCSFGATACFYLWIQRDLPAWLAAAGAMFALALLAKATPALPIVFIPVAAALAIGKKSAMLKRPAFWIVGVAIPLAILGAWLAAVRAAEPNAFGRIASEAALPLGVKGQHHTALHYHSPAYFFYKIFDIAFPASLLIPAAAWRAWSARGYREEPLLRWALFSFLGIFAVFSIIPQKQAAYMVPIFPFLAILAADAMAEGLREARAAIAYRAAGGALGVALVLAAAVAAFHFIVIARNPLPLLAVAPLLAAAGGAALFESWRGRLPRAAGAILLGWWVGMIAWHGSFKVWDAQFKTAAIYQDPSYDPARWDALFARYPPLKKVFDTSHRFLKEAKEEDDDEN